MLSAHPRDEIAELLDGRLAGARAAEVVAHVEGCAACRNELQALRLVKVSLGRLRDVASPADLLPRLAAVLDEEDRRVCSARRRSRWRGRPWTAAAAVLLLTIAGAAAFLLHEPPSDPTVEVARRFEIVRPRGGGPPRLAFTTSDPAELERTFARAGIAFPTRVLDLGMMGYRLVGGATATLGERPSVVFLYEGENGTTVLCTMYEGDLGQLAAAVDVRMHGGIRFQVYRRDGLTLVFWQEGRVVCVLVSDIDPEDVVQLAFAKAMLPGAGGALPAIAPGPASHGATP